MKIMGTAVKVLMFAAVTLALTFYIVVQITGLQFGERYKLHASFDDVTGLFAGDAVKLAGIEVGRVTSIAVAEGRAVVGFEVDKAVKLPVDSEVAVRWRNPLGQRYLYLYPGANDQLLADGGTVDRTRSVVDIGEVVNTLAPLAQNLDPARLNQLFAALAEGFSGNDANFDSLLRDVGDILATVTDRSDVVAQLVTDSNTIAAALASRDQQLHTMLDNVSVLTRAFSDNSALIERTLTELPAMAASLDTLLGSNGDELERIIANADVLGASIAGRVDDLTASVRALPAAVQDLFSIVSYGEYARAFLMCLGPTPPPCIIPTVGANGAAADAIPTPTGAAATVFDLLATGLTGVAPGGR